MSTHPLPSKSAERQEWSPVRWALAAWVWIVLLAAALVAEVVAGPLWAALVLALKFGGSDLALGIWLRHREAPALGYFAWAQAFLKIALAGCVLAIVFSSLEPLFGLPLDPMRFAGAFMMLMGGGFLTTVCIVAAARATLHDPHRLWLDKSAYGDLLANRWPLSCSGKCNRVPMLLILGLMATIGFTLLLGTAMALMAWQRGEWPMLIPVTAYVAAGIYGVVKEGAALREVQLRERAAILHAGLKG